MPGLGFFGVVDLFSYWAFVCFLLFFMNLIFYRFVLTS